MPPPPPPPTPGHHGAGPSHYEDENFGANRYPPYVIPTDFLDQHELKLLDITEEFRRYKNHPLHAPTQTGYQYTPTRQRVRNELSNLEEDGRIRDQARDYLRRSTAFNRNNRIEPYVSPPLPGLYPELAFLGVPRTQQNTFTNGVNPH